VSVRPHRAAGRAAALVLAMGVLLLGAGRADAAWTAGSGSGSAAGRAATMPAGQRPSATASGSDVTVRWPAATLPDGTPVAGYRLERFDPNGTAQPVLADCTGTLGTTTCTEHGVPAGSWTYADTPVQFGWSGARSVASAPVTVGS
jgi:hypothetical protein